LNRKTYFSLLLSIIECSGVIDIRQVERHEAKLLIHDSSPLKVEIAVVKLKKYKSPDSVVTAELIQTDGEPLHCKVLNTQ
jgi:hypothetical protein